MGWLDFLQRKDVSSDDLGQYHATSVNAPNVNIFGRRPTMNELATRYGMLVHRCVQINASTAASITPRLFALGNPQTLTKARGLNPKPLSQKTKDFMRGRMSVQPSSSVVRKLQGNLNDIVEIESHPFLDLIEDVNDQMEGVAFREAFYSDLQIFGRNFTLLVRDGSSQPTSMWRLLPQAMEIVPGKKTFVDRFDYGSGAEKVSYEPDDVFWVRLYDPSDPYGGVGPLEAWLQTVDSQFGNAVFIEQMYRKGGAPDYMLMAKNGMTDAQKRAFRSEFRRLFGKMVGRKETVGIITGEATLEPLQRSPKELQTVEQEQFTVDALAMAFGVPKSLLTTDDVNLANAREGSVTHALSTILPMLRRFEDAVNQRLLPMWSDRLFLMHDNPVREDRDIRLRERDSQLKAGYTINEIRLADDMEPLSDDSANVPMMATDIMPIGGWETDETDDEVGTDDVAETAEPVVDPDSLDKSASSFSKEWLRGELQPHCKAHDGWEGVDEDWPRSFEDGTYDIIAAMIGDVSGVATLLGKSQRDGITKSRSLTVNDADVLVSAIDMQRAKSSFEVIGEDEFPEIMANEGEAAMRDLKNRVETKSHDGDFRFHAGDPSAVEWIRANSRAMANDIPQNIAKDIRERIAKGIERDATIESIVRDLDAMGADTPDSWSRNRARMIVRTETMMAKNNGRVEAWKQSGVVKAKQFLVAPDACIICNEVASSFGSGIDLATNFFNKGDHFQYGETADGEPKVYTFDYMPMSAPPVHPFCRCSLVPVLYTPEELGAS